MSNLVLQYRKLEAQMKTLESELKAIEEKPEFARDLEFLKGLDALMKEYGKSNSEVLGVLDPSASTTKGSSNAPRGMRRQVTYKNPHTGETVTTAGGNHRVLKAWKQKYPETNIKEWIVGRQE